MHRSIVTGSRIAAALALALTVTPRVASAQSGKPPVLMPAGDLKWVDNPAVKGAKIAVLWGDPKTGAYGAFKKVPAGFKFGLHSHTADQQVVMISGTISVMTDGGPAQPFVTGSYMFMPGGKIHSADCNAGADCMYFEQQPGANDMKPAPKK